MGKGQARKPDASEIADNVEDGASGETQRQHIFQEVQPHIARVTHDGGLHSAILDQGGEFAFLRVFVQNASWIPRMSDLTFFALSSKGGTTNAPIRDPRHR